MKKIISLLVVFAMLMTLAPTAFAATGNDSVELLPNAYEGAGVITDPWIVEELPTTIEGTFDAAADDFYQFTATQAGTIDLVSWSGCMVIAYVNATVVSEEDAGETYYYFDGSFADFPIEVAVGDRVDINLFGGIGDYSVELSFEAAEVQEEVIGTIAKGNWTMALDSVVYLNYYPKFEGFSDGFDFGTRGGYVLWTGDEATLRTAPRDLLQPGKENCVDVPGMMQNENGEWYVQSPEIYAKNLGDTVYIRPYVLDADGNYVYEGIQYYSPATYCKDILGNANEREDTRYVCAALLTYGAAAQTQFGYNTEELVTEGVDLSAYDLSFKDEYISALPTTSEIDQYIKDLAADFAENNGTKAGITAGGQTLSLQGAIRMTATFTIDNSVINLDDVDTMQVLFWNESEMFDLVALTQRNAYAAELVADGNVYKAVSDHILAKNLGETIYFVARVIMNDGTMYRTGLLYLSVENWLAQEIKNNTANAEICKVIAVYGEMARVRFAENEEPTCEHENTYEDYDYCYEDGNYDLLVICEDCGEEVARYAPGTVEANPFFINNFEYNDDGSELYFTAELAAGTTYFGAYGVGGLFMTVTDADGNVVDTQTLPASWGRMPVYFNVNCETAGTYTLTFSYPEGTWSNPAELELGWNAVDVTEAGYFYNWTATEETLFVMEMYGTNWTYSIEVARADGTYYYGSTHYSNDETPVPVEVVKVCAGDVLTLAVGTADWTAATLEFQTNTYTGTADDPVMMPFNWNENNSEASAVAALPAGEYYYGQYRIGGMILTVNGVETEITGTSRWYPYTFVINNAEDGAVNAMHLSYPVGNSMNPDTLLEEGNTVTVPAGDYYGYNLAWTAPANGILTITVEGENWTYCVNNTTTGVYGDNMYAYNGDSNTYSVNVFKGDSMNVRVNIMDENYNYTGGELKISMSFVPTLTDGQYVISFGDLTFQALKETYNYGYAPAGDKNALTDLDVFTVTNTENGKFTLTDSYGRLVYMKGTYNSFNVTSDASSVTEGHEWVLELAEDGNYYIKNVLKEKYIAYSNQYTTWGAYAELNDDRNATLTVSRYAESTLVLGNNVLTAPADGPLADERFYVAEQTGTLYITIRSYFAGDENYGADMLEWYSDSTNIRINDVVVDSMQVALEVTEGELVSITLFNLDEWRDYSTDIWLSFEDFYTEIPGTEFAPVVLETTDTETIEIGAGSEAYYILDYAFGQDYTLYIYDANAYVVVRMWDNSLGEYGEWTEKTFVADENGVVKFPFNGSSMEYEIRIGNAGDTAAVFQLKAEQPIGCSYKPATLVMGDNVTTLLEGSRGYYYTWTPEADGILTLTFTGDNWAYVMYDDYYNFYLNAYAFNDAPNVVSASVTAGVPVTLQVVVTDSYDSYLAGTVNVNAQFDTLDGALSLGDNTLSVDAADPSVVYTYTAEEYGYLYLTVASLLEDGYEADASYLEEYVSLYINGVKITSADPTILNVSAGDTVTVKFVCEDLDYAYELVLNLAYGDAPAAPLELGHNNFTAGELYPADYVYTESVYTYVAEQTGTLHFTVRSWNLDQGYGSQDYGMELSGYGMSFIYINGTAVESLQTAVEVTAGDKVEFILTSEVGYLVTCEVYLSYEGFYEEPLGSEKNPVQLNYADLPCNTIEIGAYENVWYQLSDEFWGNTLTIYGETVYVAVTYYDNFEWTNVTKYYDPVDGKIEMLVEYGTLIQICNYGDTPVTCFMEAVGEVIYGTQQNPQPLTIGDNAVSLEENNSEGYYFTWTAEEAGTLTITVNGDANWRYMVYNQTSGEGGDIMMDYYDDSNTYSVNVAAGDEVLIWIVAYGDKEAGDEWVTPAGDYIVTADFVAEMAAPDVG